MTQLCTRMCCLLAGIACLIVQWPARGADEPGSQTAQPASPETESPAVAQADTEGLDQLEEVIIYGTNGKLVAGLQPESEVDAAGIAAYGANTVGDLLSQVAPDVDGSEQGPVILINGKPANGIRSVNDLPPEAIRKLQVLPPQAAGAIGESPTRRVINVVLKPQLRQGTGNLTVRGATAGQGFGGNTNVSMLQLNGNNIRNLSVYASRTEPLLEAHRGIVNQPAGLPYDLIGNVLPWPSGGGEIDPGLSSLAGRTVTVAGVPEGNTDPALADFVQFANLANVSDMGRYRTLVSEQNNYGINGNTGMSLPHNSSLNLNMYVERNESSSLTGATTTLLHVPASSPFTPFGRDTGIARYLGSPLWQQRDTTNASLGGNLSTQLGRWRLNLDTNASWTRSTTDSQRRVNTAPLQAAIDAGSLNPFDVIPDDLLDDVLSDHALARGYNGSATMQIAGALFDLPAGKANANLRGEWRGSRYHSRTTGVTNVSSDRERQEEAAYLSMQLPLLGTPQSQGMGMGGELSGSARGTTGTETMFNYGYGLNWRMGNRVQLRVGFNREQNAPQPSALSDPLVIIDGYRAYDFIRQETVLVRYITGGNPDLGVEKRDITRVSGTVRPFKPIDFTLNGEYQRTIYHDAISSLPSPSEELQAAFPDRFRRDADGRLYEIDARLVSFDRSKIEQLRWGGNFRRTFGLPKGPPTPGQGMPAGQIVTVGGVSQMVYMSDGGDDLSGAGWRFSANFNHTWQLSYKRRVRDGLPVVNLLSGGTGNGAGQSRHTVQSRIGLAYNGTGMQLNANWKSRTHIIAGTVSAPNDIVFSPFLRFDLQAFANLGTVLPNNKLAQGVRISLNVDNLFDSRQRVQDQNGFTPLRYQPYLLNPLGRVVSLSFRKAFTANK